MIEQKKVEKKLILNQDRCSHVQNIIILERF